MCRSLSPPPPKRLLGPSVGGEMLLDQYASHRPTERLLAAWELLGLGIAARTVAGGWRRLVPRCEPLSQAMPQRVRPSASGQVDATRGLVFGNKDGKEGHRWWLGVFLGTDACAFDSDTGLAFSSNGDGTLTVVEERPADHFRVVANVPTQAGARTMALDPKTHNLYLATARFKPAVPGERRRRIEPDSFVILVVGK